MVEYNSDTSEVFSVLSDPVRRDILERTTDGELSVNQIALDYDMSLAAVSKHLKIMQEAGLIAKRRDGRFIYVSSTPSGLKGAVEYVRQYEQFLEG